MATILLNDQLWAGVKPASSDEELIEDEWLIQRRDNQRTLSRPDRLGSFTLPIACPAFVAFAEVAGSVTLTIATRFSEVGADLDRIKRLAIPPAWKDVWICSTRQRAPAGVRPGRARPQTVPVSHRMATVPRRGEVRSDARLRDGASRSAPADRKGPVRRGAPTAQGRRRGRAAAREDAHSRGQRRVRARQPVVRADDDAQPAREGLEVHSCGFGSGEKVASRTTSPSTTRDWRVSSGAARIFLATSSSGTWTTRASRRTSAPQTSTRTCARSRARTSPPRASGRGQRPCSPPAPFRTRRSVSPRRSRETQRRHSRRGGCGRAGKHSSNL